MLSLVLSVLLGLPLSPYSPLLLFPFPSPLPFVHLLSHWVLPSLLLWALLFSLAWHMLVFSFPWLRCSFCAQNGESTKGQCEHAKSISLMGTGCVVGLLLGRITLFWDYCVVELLCDRITICLVLVNI